MDYIKKYRDIAIKNSPGYTPINSEYTDTR